jgi:hypothetical protein
VKPFIRATLTVASIGLFVLVTSPALAHEDREVGGYEFVVGFKNEPVFAGDKSGVEVRLTDARSGDPVVKGVELEVEVQFGDESTSFPIEPDFVVGAFGEPGLYGADFFPTRPGQYSFHITGTIAGQDVDETFTSGPDTFGDPSDPKEISFPVQDPSTGELAERLDQEVPRLTSAVEDASDTADGSKTLTYIALGAAVLALILGIASLARGRGTA